MKSINSIFLIFGITVFLYACKFERDSEKSDFEQTNIEERMKNLSTLGTVEYNFTKTIKTSDEQYYTIGARQILMTCKAHVKAGVNFENIKISKIDEGSKSIEIVLPKGEVILLNIPAEEIKIENETTGILRSNFSNEEVQKIQVLAEKDIQQKIKELNIIEKAESNATIFLEKWLKTLGFASVKITVNKSN